MFHSYVFFIIFIFSAPISQILPPSPVFQPISPSPPGPTILPASRFQPPGHVAGEEVKSEGMLPILLDLFNGPGPPGVGRGEAHLWSECLTAGSVTGTGNGLNAGYLCSSDRDNLWTERVRGEVHT